MLRARQILNSLYGLLKSIVVEEEYSEYGVRSECKWSLK